MSSLISIGAAVLKTIGLTPQRISQESEGRVPGTPVWGGMEYQTTGLGERVTTIEAITFPHVFGGLDAFARLQAHHVAQQPVNYIRLAPNWLGILQGLVIVRTLSFDEERLHPFDGVGRVVNVTIDLVHVGSAR